MRGRNILPEAIRVGLCAILVTALGYLWNPLLDPAFFEQLWSDPDVAWQSYPAKALVRREVAAGRLPLANPHVFAGMPFAGNPQAQLFYPGTLLFLPDVRIGLGAALLLHAVLAFCGAYLLARDLLPEGESRRPAALLAGIVYTFCGAMTTQIQQTAISHTSAWLPLFFWGVASGRPVRAALGTAGMLLAGHTQIASYALFLGAVVVGWDALRPVAPERRWRQAAGSAAGAGLGALLASAMLVPAAELLSISMRGRGVTEGFARVNAFQEWQFPLVYNPAAWATLHGEKYWIYPFVGTGTLLLAALALVPERRSRAARILWIAVIVLAASRPLWNEILTATKGIPIMGALYLRHWDLLVTLSKHYTVTNVLLPLGALVLLSSVAPARAQPWGIVWFLSLGLALGPEAPILGHVFRLPVLGDARGAVRFLHLYALAAAVLAALAADRAMRWGGRLARATAILPVFYLAALLLTTWQRSAIAMPFALSAVLTLAWIAVLALRRNPGGHVPVVARYVPHALLLTELLTFGTHASRVTSGRLYRYGDVDRLIPGRDPAARILVLRQGDLGCFETAYNQNAGQIGGYDGALGYEPLALRSATEIVNVARPMTVYEEGSGRLDDLKDMANVATPQLLGPPGFALLRLLRARYVVVRGVDLLAEERRVPAESAGELPGRKSWRHGAVARECYLLAVPSHTTFRIPAGASATVTFALAPDPRVAGAAPSWPGVAVEVTAEAGSRRLLVEEHTVDPTHDAPARGFREFRIPLPPSAEEIRLAFTTRPLGAWLGGFDWIGLTHPVVTIRDPERARFLARRLRPRPGTGVEPVCADPGAGPDAIYVYEMDDVLPLALAPARIAPYRPEVLADPAFDPASTLLLPDHAEAAQPAVRVLASSARGPDVDVAYEAAGPTWLLVTNAFMPGLAATVDGAPVPTARADGHFVACRVPAGRHALSIRYRPFSVRLGLFGSLVALGLIPGACLAATASRRPCPAVPAR